VLADLAELGVRRAVRVGTCLGNGANGGLGELLIVREAIAQGGSTASLGVEPGAVTRPDPELTARLQAELGGEGKLVAIASVDSHPAEHADIPDVAAIDMQTAPLLARAGALPIELAAVLIVSEVERGATILEKEPLEGLERRAGTAAAGALSP
jgi:Phosphorylase superfamily